MRYVLYSYYNNLFYDIYNLFIIHLRSYLDCLVRYLVREGNIIIRYTFRLANIISVKGAPLLLATGEILYGFRGRLVWDESETVSSFNR